MEADKKWYVIHTYSGYENKVKPLLNLKFNLWATRCDQPNFGAS